LTFTGKRYSNCRLAAGCAIITQKNLVIDNLEFLENTLNTEI
jgi:hypothetical protein